MKILDSRAHPEFARGATMPEYALMVSLILLVCFSAVVLVGVGVNSLFLLYP